MVLCSALHLLVLLVFGILGLSLQLSSKYVSGLLEGQLFVVFEGEMILDLEILDL